MKRAPTDNDEGQRAAAREMTDNKRRKTPFISARISDCNEDDETSDKSSAADMNYSDGSIKDTKVPTVGLPTPGDRLRLPDKLMEYLNKNVAPEVLYWETGGALFSFDSKKAQTELLDKYFNETKLSSFTRSLNRWGFKRLFHAMLPKNVFSYEHPMFKRDRPELVKEMKMLRAKPEESGKTDAEARQHHQPTIAELAPAPTSDRDQPLSTSEATKLASASIPIGSAAASSMASGPSGNFSSLSPAMIQSLLGLNSNALLLKQQEESSQHLHDQRLALQAIMANQQHTEMSRNLQLGLVDPGSLRRSLTSNNQSGALAPLHAYQVQAQHLTQLLQLPTSQQQLQLGIERHRHKEAELQMLLSLLGPTTGRQQADQNETQRKESQN